MRTAEISRKTFETDISMQLNLDGTGKNKIHTGIGFFDHMLTHISKHGFIDLELEAKGDLYVDCHHTIEDVGIVFGKAISEALGEKKGIKRYGSFILPMEEALVLCALDISGRPYLGFDAKFQSEKIGEMDTQMIEEFFRAVCLHAGFNLHIKVFAGKNDHHIAEAMFKAFGKALDIAVSYDKRIEGVLSTKECWRGNMIAIIDYGMGNLRSVQKAFEYLGMEAVITEEIEVMQKADKVVLPGVGAFKDAMETIRKKGIDSFLWETVKQQKPLLGICLGMQMFFEKSYEYGEHKGLGILQGEIKRLPDGVKVPHMGWNSLDIKKKMPLFEGLSQESYVYFVHSYYLQTEADIVSATTYYGKEIQVAAQKDKVFALQFHPEKSGEVGLKILKNFGRMQ